MGPFFDLGTSSFVGLHSSRLHSNMKVDHGLGKARKGNSSFHGPLFQCKVHLPSQHQPTTGLHRGHVVVVVVALCFSFFKKMLFNVVFV